MGGTPHLDRPGRAANLRIWCVICAGQTRNFQRLAVLSGVISPLRNGVDALCRPIRAEFRAYGRRRQQAFALVTASQGQMWSHFGVDPETQSGAALSGSQAQVSCPTVWLANHMREIQACPQARCVHNRTMDIGTRGFGHNGANNLHWGAVGVKPWRGGRDG